MAEERLTLLMASRGARRVKRDVDRVARSIDRVGITSLTTNKRVGFLERGLRLFQTRLGFIIVLGGLLAATLGPPLLGGIVLLTAAIVALGGALIPMIALGVAAGMQFSMLKDVVGTSANDLALAAGDFKFAFQEALAPGADLVLGALARALKTLEPLLRELAPAFTLVGGAMATAIDEAARGFAMLGPDFTRMFVEAAPLIAQMGRFMPALTLALVHLAIAGMPVLLQLLTWLTEFSFWLGPAIDDANRFAHTAGFLAVVGTAMAVVAGVAEYLARLIANLATIFYELYVQTKPVTDLLAKGLLWALIAFGDAVDFVSGHMEIFGPLIIGVIGPLLILVTVFKTLAFVTAIWNAILLVNPIALIAVGIGLLIATLYILYTRFQIVRDVVKFVWQLFWNHPFTLLIRLVASLLIKLWRARDAFVAVGRSIGSALGTAIRAVKGPIDWLVGKLKWIWDHSPQKLAGGLLGKGLGKLGGLIPGRAEGGHVRRGGAYVVGERRPELFVPDRDGTIHPSANVGTGGDFVMAPVLLSLDGQIVARTVQRQAIRKRSTE